MNNFFYLGETSYKLRNFQFLYSENKKTKPFQERRAITRARARHAQKRWEVW